MKRKIVIDARMIQHSGIGEYIKLLVPVLNRTFELKLIGNDHRIKESLPFIHKKQIIQCNFSIYGLKEIFLLGFFIPKCHIFFSPHYNIPILPIKARRRVVTIHDVNHLDDKSIHILKKIYAYIMLYVATKISHKIISVSIFSKKRILHYFPLAKKKIDHIYNGFSEERFKIKKALPLQNDKAFILCVGNLKPHKNLSTVLKAYNHLPEKIKETYNLIFVGNFSNLNSKDYIFKEALESEKNRVQHFENITNQELSYLYSKATLFIFPSLYEGFGLPLIEAMYFNLPIIASEIEPFKEIGGHSIEYFNPYSVEDLEIKMFKMLENQFRTQTKTYNLDRFSKEKMEEKHLNLLKKID